MGLLGSVLPKDSKKVGSPVATRQILLSWNVMRSGRGQESQGPCSSNCLGPVVDTELAVDVACVDLDCVQREVGPGGDFTIDRSIGEECEDF